MANTLDIPRGTVWSIVDRYRLVLCQRGGGRPVKVDDDVKQCVVRLVEQHPSYTLHQLNAETQCELPNKSVVCDFTLHRLMKG